MTQNEMEAGAAGAPHKAMRRGRGMIVLAILGCVILQFVPTWQLQRPDSRVMRDFSAFYAAGTIVREGQGNRLYDPAVELRIERERTMRPDQIGFLPYPHAPFEALLFAALSVFSYSTASWIWWGCNVVLVFAVLHLLRPFLPALEPHIDLVVLCVGAFHPLVISEAQGQDSVLSLFLFVVAFVFLRRGRDFWAGAILALALYKPQLVLPAVLILVVASKRRGLIAAGFGVSCICLVLVSIATVGWKAALDYPRFLTRFKAVGPNNILSVYSLAHAVLGTQVGKGYVMVGAGLVLMAIAGSAIWILRGRPPVTERTYALLMIAAPLLASHAYLHDLTVLSMPVLVAANWLVEGGVRGPSRRGVLSCVALAYVLPMLYWNPRVYVAVLLGFYVAFLWEICDAKRLLEARVRKVSVVAS